MKRVVNAAQADTIGSLILPFPFSKEALSYAYICS